VTVLAALHPGADVRLRGVLRAIGDDVKGKRLSFARVRASPSSPIPTAARGACGCFMLLYMMAISKAISLN
jgi:hypothetical protein